MKLPRFASLLIFLSLFAFVFLYSRLASAQDAPPPAQPAPQKPSPDNPPPPVPQPAPETPAQQPVPQQPAPDSSSQPQQPQPNAPNPPDAQNPYPAPKRQSEKFLRGENYSAPWEGAERWGLLSRVGIGADISPLGIGIKSATILTSTLDLRVMGNFLNFNSPSFEVEGTRAQGTIHFASLQTAIDFYPRRSVWRLSVGALLWNANQISATGTEAPGTSFTLNGQTYYSASGTANCSTGVEPVTSPSSSSSSGCPVGASAVVGFHTNQPALTASFGFGRYVPHSGRHWSFPSEFGVVFMGAPSLNISPFGTVCTTPSQAPGTCSDVADTSTPAGAAFNQSLQTAEVRWRRSLGRVTVYPLFSYGVMYSFNVRTK